MSYGAFVDRTTGAPVYWGEREPRARLEATHDWVDSRPPSPDHRWDGAQWVESADAVAAREAAEAEAAARVKALQALFDEQLEARAAEPDAPQAIKDWAQARGQGGGQGQGRGPP